MRAEYKKQALLGDRVMPNVAVREKKYIVSLCDREAEPYAVIEFTGR